MAAEILSEASKSYLRLAAEWPPHVPRDDDDYEAGVKVIYALSGRSELGETLDAGEEMYLEAVAEMLAIFDAKHENLAGDLTLPQRLEGLMENAMMTPPQLAQIGGLGEDEIADVVAGRRELSREAIRRLAAHFKLSVDFFF